MRSSLSAHIAPPVWLRLIAPPLIDDVRKSEHLPCVRKNFLEIQGRLVLDGDALELIAVVLDARFPFAPVLVPLNLSWSVLPVVLPYRVVRSVFLAGVVNLACSMESR